MALITKLEHWGRYKDVLLLIARHGRADLLHQAGLDGHVADQPQATARAEALTEDLERLGATFVKLGQMLSTRSDLLPPAYLAALARLQDHVEPFPFDDVERIVEEELGVRISKAFSEFEEQPLAAASLGQVHRARLRDGRRVAVKVQRPEVRKEVQGDLTALAELARALDHHTELGRRYGLRDIVEQFRRTLVDELDYRREADHLRAIGHNLRKRERIVVPAPVDDFCSLRVLTMDYVEGTQVSRLSPLVRTELQGTELADELCRAYLQQVLVDGLFHADPHPGNVLLTPERRVALIDLGMVGRVQPTLQKQLLEMILAIADGEGEHAARVALRMSRVRDEHADPDAFRALVADLVARRQGATLEELQIGRVFLEIAASAGRHGVRIPPELTLLGKTLLSLDQIGQLLDPGFDPARSVRAHASEITSRQTLGGAGPSQLYATLLQSKELIQDAPERLNQILEHLAENRIRVKVDSIDERVLLVGMQKISNRITVGLVVAALIVGAGLLMSVDTRFKIMGYPGLAMILFLSAALGALLLLITVMRSDRNLPRT